MSAASSSWDFAVAAGYRNVAELKSTPALDELSSDERFKALIAELE